MYELVFKDLTLTVDSEKSIEVIVKKASNKRLFNVFIISNRLIYR